MEQTLTTCPRGHPVAPSATRCLTCGTHVEPSAPNPFDADRIPVHHRAPRSWPSVRPLVGASLVVLVVAGWIVGSRVLAPPTDPVAGAVADPVADPVAAAVVDAPTTGPVTQQVAVPEAGTVPSAAPSTSPVDVAPPDPVPAVTPTPPVVVTDDCAVVGTGASTTCSPSGELVTFPVCVPADTSAVQVRTRKGPDAAWKAPADRPVLQGQGACAAGTIEAQLTLKVKEGVGKEVRVTTLADSGTTSTVDVTVTRATASS